MIASHRAVIDGRALGAGFDARAEIVLDRQPDGAGRVFGAFLRASVCIVWPLIMLGETRISRT